MSDGLVFVWSHKAFHSDLIKHMELQEFHYVENVVAVMLDQNKKEELDQSGQIDISPAIVK